MNREELLQEILRLPWRTVLAKPLVPRREQPQVLVDSPLTCAVTVRGDWMGRMVVSCDRALAEMLALRLDGQSTPSDHVQALRWLTTTLGTAVRNVMATDVGLGFPVVVDHDPPWARHAPAIALHFSSGASALTLALYGDGWTADRGADGSGQCSSGEAPSTEGTDASPAAGIGLTGT